VTNSSIDDKDSILSVKDLKKYFGATKAVDGVDLDVKPGEIVCIIGRSGAGKSTFMRCINRLVLRDQGRITFEGAGITNQMSSRQLCEIRKRMGFVFQDFNLVYRLTVFQNVMHGRLGYMSTLDGVFGRYSEDDKMKAYDIIEALGLEEQLYQRAADLSGGQKQRVAIARALMQEPSLLMCDEPIASLDPVTSRTILDLIVSQAKERGIACLINLHQVDFAIEYSTRIIGMRNGKFVFNGSSATLTDETIAYIYEGDDAWQDSNRSDVLLQNIYAKGEYTIV